MRPEERLLKYRRINEATGCWEWTGGTSGGYGSASTYPPARYIAAHRLAAVVWMGLERDSPLQVLHKCDNRVCFNPHHLYLGTHEENMRDRRERGGYRRGEQNPAHKLNWYAVRLIRELQSKGYSMYVLSKAFAVDYAVIQRIVRNEIWVEEGVG
jgi:hypothetical protein